MKRLSFIIVLLSIVLLAYRSDKSEADFVTSNYTFADSQLHKMLKVANKNPLGFPRTTNKAGEMTSTDMYDWTSGFFSGSLWYAYENTKDPTLKAAATDWTEKLEPVKTFTKHHDLGFMMYCSYGNAYRITGNKAYKDILVQTARSLSTRFSPVTGSIKSWNTFASWHGGKPYNFPVIIDNLMNLELLFFASKASGDTMFRHIAISHATQAMHNQIRKDYSSYHVVCYDSSTGKVLARETAQGYADNSTWARGQAWGIYGFTMAYRETKNPEFLKTAQGMADWYLNNKNLPADKIPYWDFNANQIGYTPGVKSHTKETTTMLRDVSAASVTASALLELSTYTGKKGKQYRTSAVQMLHTLAGPNYRAPLGANGNFLLEHSVGTIPHGNEIDAPLVYADYYFLEALQRYHRLLESKNVVGE